jgi:membrane-associated protease RseP (regulator of RpoE activity)
MGLSTVTETTGAEMAFHVRATLRDLFELRDVTLAAGGVVRLRGRLRRPAEEAYRLVAERLKPLGYTPIFRRQGQDDVIQALPGLAEAQNSRSWLGAGLFVATALSMLLTGFLLSGWDPARGLLANLLGGAPFMLSLLSILVAHELGHYVVGRHYGVPVSLPYFIPMPFSIFGTMGAFIRLKAPPTNRRVLLAIAVAGPLAGLAVALPLLVAGLRLSQVGPIVAQGGIQEGNSLLYAAVKYIIFGRYLPGGGLDVHLHPVAFGAWAGLFVTGLNLIPAGQLDGGHIVYALIGHRARYLTTGLVVALALLGVRWPGWFLWAGLLFLFRQTFAVPLDDITRLGPWRMVLAVAMLVLFVVVFTPVPLVPL